MAGARGAPKASTKLLEAQNLVLEMILSNAPLEGVLRALTALIELRTAPARCSIFLPGAEGALDGLPIGPLAVASGAAADRKERVIVPDTAVDPLYQQSDEAGPKHGLRSCWSTPILSQKGALLAVITVYRKRPHVPDQSEISAVEEAGRLARMAIERRNGEAERELISNQDAYRELFENANEVMYTHDLAGRLTSLNKAGEALTGFSREEAIRMNMSELVAPEYRKLWREKLDSQIGGEVKTTYELEIVNKGGRESSWKPALALSSKWGGRWLYKGSRGT